MCREGACERDEILGIGELTAICEALEALTGPIEVRTDSTYVQKCFDQNWHERWLRRTTTGSTGSPELRHSPPADSVLRR